jgi:protein subunit release factor A
METVIIEIRSAEGGEDAKLLVNDQLGVYLRYANRRGL